MMAFKDSDVIKKTFCLLTLSTLDKIIIRRHIFLQKHDLAAGGGIYGILQKSLQCQILFSGEKKKYIANLSCAE